MKTQENFSHNLPAGFMYNLTKKGRIQEGKILHRLQICQKGELTSWSLFNISVKY